VRPTPTAKLPTCFAPMRASQPPRLPAKLGLAAAQRCRIASRAWNARASSRLHRPSRRRSAGQSPAPVVMMRPTPNRQTASRSNSKKMPEVRSLAAVSGSYDLVAQVETATAARIDVCSTVSARAGRGAHRVVDHLE